MGCKGEYNEGDHCCWIEGVACPFLEEETVQGRHWACGLLRELGSWEKVHTDPRYVATLKPIWEQKGIKDCGNYTCENCS